MPSLNRKAIQSLIRVALREDQATCDITSHAVLPPSLRIRARVIAKSPGVLAGGPAAMWTFHTIDPSLYCTLKRRDGARLQKGQTILVIEGSARSIFAAERTTLNFLGHLSGIATLTAEYVRRVQGTKAKILDTRKTLPGLRLLEKYAVRIGGGQNHRTNLAKTILIKTNHLRALRERNVREAYLVKRETCIAHAIRTVRQHHPKTFLEVEVTGVSEFVEALQARPDAILLDNWHRADIKRAVRLRNTLHASRFTKLEVSGGVTLANVRAIAKTGVDRISIGRLTHSAPSLDVSLAVI